MPTYTPLIDRFWEKVELDCPGGCWLWTASTTDGYGMVWSGADGGSGRMLYAHRVAYELLVGPIPEGLTLDHLCRVRLCVNPAHLEPVTGAENTRRGEVGRYARAAKTRCKTGHPFDLANTYVKPDGTRDCRTCIRLRVQAYKLRKANA